LAVWRATRRYNLPFLKIGARVMYHPGDVLAFIVARRRSALQELNDGR
jgi:hypothetical protein